MFLLLHGHMVCCCGRILLFWPNRQKSCWSAVNERYRAFCFARGEERLHRLIWSNLFPIYTVKVTSLQLNSLQLMTGVCFYLIYITRLILIWIELDFFSTRSKRWDIHIWLKYLPSATRWRHSRHTHTGPPSFNAQKHEHVIYKNQSNSNLSR